MGVRSKSKIETFISSMCKSKIEHNMDVRSKSKIVK